MILWFLASQHFKFVRWFEEVNGFPKFGQDNFERYGNNMFNIYQAKTLIERYPFLEAYFYPENFECTSEGTLHPKWYKREFRFKYRNGHGQA